MTTDLPDFATIAGFYSQLAGVLAGFAFAGLIALAAAQFTSGTHATGSLESFLPLVSTFIGLVSASLNYAIIAGESGPGRSAMLETVGGLGFCIAGVMLFYSLVVLLHGAKVDGGTTTNSNPTIDNAVAFTRRTLIFGVAPTVIILLQGGVADQEAVKFGVDIGLRWPDYIAFTMVAMTLVAAGIGTRIAGKAATTSTPASPMTISVVATGISLLCVIATTLIGIYVPEDALTPAWLQVCVLSCLFAFILYVTHSALKYR
jgi:hypothetical protein